jgi:hypothetical protein
MKTLKKRVIQLEVDLIALETVKKQQSELLKRCNLFIARNLI